jgi:hypothetical protein
MRLVQEHAPLVPIPELYTTSYLSKDGCIHYGELYMSNVPGQPLTAVWAELDDASKERACQNIWDLVAKIRTIPRPDHLRTNLYCTSDGSPSYDPLLGSTTDIPPLFIDDDTFRNRISARYIAHNGLSYRDGDLLDLLPRSETSVFTHGDIGLRNIMVDAEGCILAFLDWESAGWFPEYWEFAQMMKPCDPIEYTWQHWMDRTKPEPWDITGIQKARRVLF